MVKKVLLKTSYMDAFKNVEEKTGNPALEVFEEAINNIMPVLELKARRIGGATTKYHRSRPVKEDMTLGLRWLVNLFTFKKTKNNGRSFS